jgi:hypothetical protein
MRKIALTISIAAASLLVTACGTPKEADNSANATEAMAPVAEANGADTANSSDTNALDAKMAGSAETGNVGEDDDKGGDPGSKK